MPPSRAGPKDSEVTGDEIYVPTRGEQLALLDDLPSWSCGGLGDWERGHKLRGTGGWGNWGELVGLTIAVSLM